MVPIRDRAGSHAGTVEERDHGLKAAGGRVPSGETVERWIGWSRRGPPQGTGSSFFLCVSEGRH